MKLRKWGCKMTEEQIKRFVIECSEHDAAIFNDGWDIMPAPSKDWRPFCFYLFDGELDTKGICEGGHRTDNFQKYCKDCPFRLQGEK